MGDLTTIEAQNLDALAQDLGTGGKSSSRVIMDELKINYDTEDDNDNTLTPGDMFIKEGGKGNTDYFYTKNVTFRPLWQVHQYSIYDPQENKMSCRSIMIENFREEAKDTQGTFKCGKPSSKEMKDFTKEQREKYKNIKNTRQLRGLLTCTATNVRGETKEYKDFPILIKLNGQNNYQMDANNKLFAPFESQFLNHIPNGTKMWNFNISLTTERRKNALKKSYYVYSYEPDFGTPLAVTKDVYDTVVMIKDLILSENADIEAEYYQAVRAKSYDAEATDTLDKMHKSLDADYEDVA